MEDKVIEELEATLCKLSAGFTALSIEFRALYARQEALEKRLKASGEEVSETGLYVPSQRMSTTLALDLEPLWALRENITNNSD